MTAEAMIKIVPGEEFLTANRMVAATKLSDGDMLETVCLVNEEANLVLQSKEGMFLKFSMEEVPLLKKNSRGVRGMKLRKNDEVEQAHLFEDGVETRARVGEKEILLNRLKAAKRDGNGTKPR